MYDIHEHSSPSNLVLVQPFCRWVQCAHYYHEWKRRVPLLVFPLIYIQSTICLMDNSIYIIDNTCAKINDDTALILYFVVCDTTIKVVGNDSLLIYKDRLDIKYNDFYKWRWWTYPSSSVTSNDRYLQKIDCITFPSSVNRSKTNRIKTHCRVLIMRLLWSSSNVAPPKSMTFTLLCDWFNSFKPIERTSEQKSTFSTYCVKISLLLGKVDVVM